MWLRGKRVFLGGCGRGNGHPSSRGNTGPAGGTLTLNTLKATRVIIAPGYWICKSPATESSRNGWLLIPRNRGWQFNGDTENPTFTPSIKETHPRPDKPEWCNHYVITDGKVAYCGDCTHEFAGQTLDLLEWTDAEIACHSEEKP